MLERQMHRFGPNAVLTASRAVASISIFFRILRGYFRVSGIMSSRDRYRKSISISISVKSGRRKHF